MVWGRGQGLSAAHLHSQDAQGLPQAAQYRTPSHRGARAQLEHRHTFQPYRPIRQCSLPGGCFDRWGLSLGSPLAVAKVDTLSV